MYIYIYICSRPLRAMPAVLAGAWRYSAASTAYETPSPAMPLKARMIPASAWLAVTCRRQVGALQSGHIICGIARKQPVMQARQKL